MKQNIFTNGPKKLLKKKKKNAVSFLSKENQGFTSLPGDYELYGDW